MTNVLNISEKIKRNRQRVEITERFDFLARVAADSRICGTNGAAVAIYLLDCRNGQTGLINPGMAKIAKGAGCSVATAKRAIYKLEEAGWFIIIRHKNEGGKNDSNEYVPNWDQGRVAGGLGVGSQANEGRVTDELGSVTGERGVVRLRAANPVKLNPVKEPSESTQEKDIACGDVLADDLIDDRWRHASMWTFSTEDMEDAMRLTGLNSIEIDSKIDEFIAQAESAGELHDDWSPIWRVWIGLSAVDSESYKDRPAVYLDQDRYWTLAGDDGSHPAGQLEALGDDAHYDEDPPF